MVAVGSAIKHGLGNAQSLCLSADQLSDLPRDLEGLPRL